MERTRAQNVERAAALRAEGDALAEQGSNRMAAAKYTDAIDRDPTNADVRFRRGLVLLREGTAALAEHDFARAIELGGDVPVVAEYYLNRGNARIRQGKVQEALEDYANAVALNPENRTAWLELGRAYEQAAEGAADSGDRPIYTTAAISAYSRAITVDPKFAEAYFNRGAAFERSGERKQAIDDFQRVIALPSATPQMKQAGQARLAQFGVTVTAATPAQRRLRVTLHHTDPDDARTADALARSLRKSGYAVDQPERRFGEPGGQVLFFFPQDEKAAAEVRSLVQSQIARAGTAVRLEVLYRDAKLFQDMQPGTVEVWLPPLSAPVGVAPIEQTPRTRY
jgi:tetratricopeptide (TPR) repeat protein